MRRKAEPSNEAFTGLATGSAAPVVSPITLEKAIGLQVRQRRSRLGLTAAELAHAAGLSAGMMSKIEGGSISPSLATLQSIARALNTPVASLMAESEDRRDCSFVKKGGGVTIERRGTKAGHHYQLLGHSLAGDITVEPYLIGLTGEAAPYTDFRHEGLELIYMLTGKVRYRHGEASYVLEPGDTLFFDAAAPHGPEELIERPMTYLSVIIYPRA